MHRLLPALVVAVLLLCGVPASAVTLASRFPELESEVATRLGALPVAGLSKDQKKEKSSLGKIGKALAKDTDDLARTLKNARKAVLKIDTTYPADPVFAPLLDDVVADLSLDVTRRGGELFKAVQALPDGAAKTKAQGFSDASEAEIVAAVGEAVRADQLAHLSAANALIAKAEKVVKRAGGGGGNAATNELDVDIGGSHLHLPPASGNYVYTVTYEAEGDVLLLTVSGTIDTTTHFFSLRVPTPGLGSHPIQGGPQTTYTSSAITGTPFVLIPGATMDFTTFDTALGKYAATFSATFTNGANTVELTNGRFTRVN